MLMRLIGATAASALFSLSLAMTAGATAIVAATEPTQVVNMGQLIIQVEQQIETVMRLKAQFEHMVEQARSLNDGGNWLQTVQTVHGIHTAVHGFHQSTFAAASIAEDFQRTHPGVVMPTDYRNQYDQLRRMNMGSAEQALRQIGMHDQQVNGTQQVLQHLMQNVTSADSQRAATDAGNHLLAEIVRQLQMLNQTNRALLQVMSVATSTADQRAGHEEAVLRDRYKRRPPPMSKGRTWENWSNEGTWAR